MLRGAHGGHITVLRDDMDKGVAADDTDGQQGRADGTDTAEEQSQGGQDAGHGGNTVRRVMVAAVRDIHADQVRWPAQVVGGGRTVNSHAGRTVAGRLQQFNQPGAVRVLQQEVSAGVHGRAPE